MQHNTKISGTKLKLQIAESNLVAKCAELDRVQRLTSELINERDFLRKLLLQMTVH